MNEMEKAATATPPNRISNWNIDTQHTAHKFVLMNNITSSAQINGMNISACICIGNGLIMIMTAAYDGCAHGSVIHTTNANMPNNAVHSFVQNEIQLSYTHIHTTHDATATVWRLLFISFDGIQRNFAGNLFEGRKFEIKNRLMLSFNQRIIWLSL